MNTSIEKTYWGILFGLSVFGWSEVHAGNSIRASLGDAADFSVVVFGDFSSPIYSSATGRMAAGGNIAAKNYGVATGLDPRDAGISVVAGGNLSLEYGKVHAGHIVVSGSADLVGSAVRNGLGPSQLLLDHVDSPIDFSRLESELAAQSKALSQVPANGTVRSEYGGLYLAGDCISDLQVFSVDGSMMLPAHSFEVTCVPADAHIIFNISGVSTGMSNMTLKPLRSRRSRVLFNFYEATDLTLSNIGIEGSVLAPKAVINNPTGVIHGTVVAKAWNGSMHLDYVRYQGYNEDTAICEGPAAL